MIQVTGNIQKDSVTFYANPTLNLKITHTVKTEPIFIDVQVCLIEGDIINPITLLKMYQYQPNTNYNFDDIELFVKSKLEEDYPEVEFSIL